MIELFLVAAIIELPKGVPVVDFYEAASRLPSLELDTPEQYKGPATSYTIWVNHEDVPKWCGEAPKGLIKMGCMMDDKRLLLSNPCDERVWPEVKNKRSYAHYVCHEKAHVNGWSH
jgi:hypothetical protein